MIVETIRQILYQSANQSGSGPALMAIDGRALSYDELMTQLAELQKQLRSLGIGRNDRVAIVLPNGLEMALTFLAVAGAATAAPLNPNYRRQEFAFYLQDLRPKALVLLPETQTDLRQLAKEMDLPVLEVVTDPDQRNASFSFRGETGYVASHDGDAKPADIALILHTSGTTSRPKMVPLSQQNLSISAGNIARTLTLEGKDRCLNIMPLFHIHGLMAGLLASLYAGSSVVCAPFFDAAAFFSWMVQNRPTWYTAVPTMHQAILDRAAGNVDVVSRANLRFLRSSSASLPPPVMAELESTFNAPVIEAYGMTEATHQMASNLLPPAGRKPGTVGVMAGPEVAIMHEERGDLLAAGETGEIVIRGPNVTAGYLENPEADAKAFVSGWFRTGDQGFFDDDGYLTISGRLKEIINRGGEKIAPREIDDVLLEHPAVQQAVAFAMPDPRLGEEVAAAVVLRQGETADAQSLQHYVAGRLADFKVPRRIVFVPEVPKGPTGKLQRVGLAEALNVAPARADVTPVADEQRADPEVEQFVKEMWCEVLSLPDVPLDSTFLELGGESLQATQLINRLNERLGLDMNIVDLFDAPTVAHQARLVQEKLLADQTFVLNE